MSGTVWIAQESEGKSFAEALPYGRLRIAFLASNQNVLKSHIDIERRLGRYNPDTDWLVCVGSPEIIGACCAWIGKQFSALRLLVWDKRARDYIPVEFTI